MILSDKQRNDIITMLEYSVLGMSISEEHEGLMNDLRPMCPPTMRMHEFLKEVARTGRTDSLDPLKVPQNTSWPPLSALSPGQPASDASGMREVQARIRQIIKAEPSSGIYMIMLKCYDDPVCRRWYKTSPWLLRIQITNAIRAIIDAEEADVLAFISGAPVAPSDF